MDRLTSEQLRRNTLSREAWTLYEPHRERVTSLLLNALTSDGQGSVCILGAGNCNDIDLRQLLERVQHVHLVDLDRSALEAGIENQQLTRDERIACHAPVDLTGMLTELAHLTSDATPALVTSISQRLLQTLGFTLPQRCEVVASVGLLSQLIELARDSLGAAHPSLLELITALRTQHFRQLNALTAPGGSTLLVTEIVSTDTAPELLSTSDANLSNLLVSLVISGSFFTGLNPAVIEHALSTDSAISPRLRSLQIARPWLWPFIARTYACTAFLARLE